MPITFQICQVYNKGFYRNLNELACLLTCYYLVAYGAFWPSPSLGWLQDRTDEQTCLSFIL
jgi:hypothetical protein